MCQERRLMGHGSYTCYMVLVTGCLDTCGFARLENTVVDVEREAGFSCTRMGHPFPLKETFIDLMSPEVNLSL